MKKTTIYVGLLLALTAPYSYAGRLDAVQYECEQTGAERDGIRCAARRVEDMGPVLFIRVHAKPDASVELRKRAGYMKSRTIHNFLAVGGDWIYIRTYNKAGQLVELSCPRAKGRDFEVCGDPYGVSSANPNLAKYWKPLE